MRRQPECQSALQSVRSGSHQLADDNSQGTPPGCWAAFRSGDVRLLFTTSTVAPRYAPLWRDCGKPMCESRIAYLHQADDQWHYNRRESQHDDHCSEQQVSRSVVRYEGLIVVLVDLIVNVHRHEPPKQFASGLATNE
jgi:hypothetical protein